MLILTLIVQVYIVVGGYSYSNSDMGSTEILAKDWDSAWQVVASLPSGGGRGVRGLGLDNGRFIITGESWTILYHHNLHS